MATVHGGRIDVRIEVEATVVIDGAVSGEVTDHGDRMVAVDATGMIPIAAVSVATTPDGCVRYVDAAGRR